MDIYTRKFELIEDSLQKLSAIRRENPSLDQYRNSWKDRDAAERNLQKIIEAFIDVGKMIIAEKRFREPGNNREVFLILAGKKIFSSEFMTLVDKMIGMRNIIVHEYGEVDDFKVYNSITEELEEDVNNFIKCVESLK